MTHETYGGPTLIRAWRSLLQSRPYPLTFDIGCLANEEVRSLFNDLYRMGKKLPRSLSLPMESAMWLIHAYRNLQAEDRAIRFLRALPGKTEGASAIRDIAQAWRDPKQEDEANRLLKTYLKRFPEASDIRYSLFYNFYQKGRYREALEGYGHPLCETTAPPSRMFYPTVPGDVIACYRQTGKMTALERLIAKSLLKNSAKTPIRWLISMLSLLRIGMRPPGKSAALLPPVATFPARTGFNWLCGWSRPG
ncbi:MAG: hypothetical protein IT210_04275 [Armatimonadetes bacterium]|nr:hypothetical protein [Armatimonadota bacterium]